MGACALILGTGSLPLSRDREHQFCYNCVTGSSLPAEVVCTDASAPCPQGRGAFVCAINSFDGETSNCGATLWRVVPLSSQSPEGGSTILSIRKAEKNMRTTTGHSIAALVAALVAAPTLTLDLSTLQSRPRPNFGTRQTATEPALRRSLGSM